jgi:hypothetical protein
MFVRLRVVQDEFEAQQVEGFLEEAGIEYERLSFRDTALDGLFQGQKGFAEIRVAVGDRARAEQLLAEEMGNAQLVDAAEIERAALEAKPEDATPSSAADARSNRLLIYVVLGLVLIAGILLFWRRCSREPVPPAFQSSLERIQESLHESKAPAP